MLATALSASWVMFSRGIRFGGGLRKRWDSITLFDASQNRSDFVCEVNIYEWSGYLDYEVVGEYDRCV